jgi:hypothetical protein
MKLIILMSGLAKEASRSRSYISPLRGNHIQDVWNHLQSLGVLTAVRLKDH